MDKIAILDPRHHRVQQRTEGGGREGGGRKKEGGREGGREVGRKEGENVGIKEIHTMYGCVKLGKSKTYT